MPAQILVDKLHIYSFGLIGKHPPRTAVLIEADWREAQAA